MCHTNEYPAKVERFFEGLKSASSIFEELRATYNEKMAFDFNTLDFFYPNENKFSEILAHFLNPKASHGQGDAFIRVFCDLLKEKYNSENTKLNGELLNKKITVKTEHRTDQNRRIDLTVEFGNKEFFIGIENKIWAADQNDQVKHYSDFLEKQDNGNYVLFYLTPYGKEPSEYSIDTETRKELAGNNHLKILSYDKDIIELFEQFIMVCKAERVQFFLKEFQNHIKQRFTGERDMDASKYIQDYISKSEDAQNIAFDIVQNIDSVRNSLWEKVKQELSKFEHTESDLQCIFKDKFSDVYNGTWVPIIEFKSPRWTMAITFGSKNASNFFYIITGNSETGLTYPFLLQLKDEIGCRRTNEDGKNIHDILEEYCPSWRVSSKPWRDMIQEEENGWCTFTNNMVKLYKKAKDGIKKIEETSE